jgi:acetate kinase
MLNGIGICIDEGKNGRKCNGEFIDITGDGSKAKVFVIPTDEELVIARDTITIVGS